MLFDVALEAAVQDGTREFRQAGTGAALAAVLSRSRHMAYLEGSPQGDRFAECAFYGIARNALWDSSQSPAGAFKLLDKLPDTVYWASLLADTGESLIHAEHFTNRGRSVLRRSALKFEVVYTNMTKNASLDERALTLLGDYARVLQLQQAADDPLGSLQTARWLAPHLMQISGEMHQKATIGQERLGPIIQLVGEQLGGLTDGQACELLDQTHH